MGENQLTYKYNINKHITWYGLKLIRLLDRISQFLWIWIKEKRDN